MILPTGPCPATIMLIGDIPSPDDSRTGIPLSGSQGHALATMLHEAGISIGGCFRTNVMHLPAGQIDSFLALRKRDQTPHMVPFRDKMVKPILIQQIAILEEEIKRCNPSLIIALGDLPSWVLTGNWSSLDWRGSVVPCTLFSGSPKVLITIHPGKVLRQWPLRAPVVQDFRRALKESATREIQSNNYSFTIRPSFTSVIERLVTLRNKAAELSENNSPDLLKLSVDIETRNWHISCLGIAWSTTEAICIPFMSLSNPSGYWTAAEEALIVFHLYQLLTHKSVLVVGQNYIFDQQYIHRGWHFISPNVRDTMIAQHVCFPGASKGLDYIASLYCESYRYWKGDGKIWAGADEEANWLYNCEDTVRTYECDTVLQSIVDQLGIRYAHDFQQSLFHPVLTTMIRGVRIDHQAQETLIKELRVAQKACHDWLTLAIGHPINPKSPKQIADLFYRDLGQSPYHSRTSGGETTNGEALEKIATRQPLLRPIVQRIEELRSIGIFLSTFLGDRTGKWTRDFLDEDGRIRCSYNVAGTVTFRFASGESAFGHGTNLQNIPKGD